MKEPGNPVAHEQQRGLQRLRQRFAWPDVKPDTKQLDWCLDAGGKHLVSGLIQSLPAGAVVLEIGSFLGGSARLWLDSSAQITLICVDPWTNQHSLRDFARKQGQPEWAADQLESPDGIFKTFQANLWKDRHRVIPVRGYSPEALDLIAAAAVRPDLIYLDADKTGREIEVCHRLFPDAKLTGDDWWFGVDKWWRPDEGYPIRGPVNKFCRRHKRFLRTEKMTWVIDDLRPPLSYQLRRPLYHFKSVRRRLRGLLRAATGRA